MADNEPVAEHSVFLIQWLRSDSVLICPELNVHAHLGLPDGMSPAVTLARTRGRSTRSTGALRPAGGGRRVHQGQSATTCWARGSSRPGAAGAHGSEAAAPEGDLGRT